MLLPDGTEIWFWVHSGRRGPSESDVYDTALYDNALYDGGSVIRFTNYAERVLGVATRRGKDAFGKRFRTGQATIDLDNSDGIFVNGPFQPGDYVWIRALFKFPAGAPDEPIIDQTTWPDVTGRQWTAEGSGMILSSGGGTPVYETFDLFYGRVDGATDRVRGGVDTTRVRVFDIFADLAIIDKDAQAAQGAGEDANARIERILANAGGFPLFEQGIFEATMQATTLAGQVLSDMQLTSDSEGGDVWADITAHPVGNSKGGIQLRGRDWLTTENRSTVIQWRLGGTTDIGITDAQTARESALIVNDATFSVVGGTAQNSQDAASIQRYGNRSHRRLDLIAEGDTQPQFLAQRMVGNLAAVRPRIREVTVPVEDADSARMAHEAQMGDLVLTQVNSFRGWGNAALGHIIGIEHGMVEDQWTVRFTLDDAFVENVDGAFDYQQFDDSFALGGQP